MTFVLIAGFVIFGCAASYCFYKEQAPFGTGEHYSWTYMAVPLLILSALCGFTSIAVATTNNNDPCNPGDLRDVFLKIDANMLDYVHSELKCDDGDYVIVVKE